MSIVPVLGALVGAVLFGAVAWRRLSKTIWYRSSNPTIRPAHMTPAEYDAWTMARRRRARLAKVIGAAAVGALLGALAVTMVSAGLGRR